MKVTVIQPQLATDGPLVPSGVVLHATAGSTAVGAIETLRERRLSYHYIIEKTGNILKCAPAEKKARHAGVSEGWAGQYCNRYTIGISFVNEDTGPEHPITDKQYSACVELIKELVKTYPTIQHITTHHGVSYPRKVDPTQCDAAKIAKKVGIAYWPGRRTW